VRSRAVARALVDTFAIFYRLRILRTYQRKRTLVPRGRRHADAPLVSVIADAGVAERLDWQRLEVAKSAREAAGELLAIAAPGAGPAGNWVTAAASYFSSGDVAAVVAPTVAPSGAPLRESVAAAVLESRLGGGSRRSRSLPGNVGTVSEYAPDAIVVRRRDYLEALDAGVEVDELVAWLTAQGRTTIYTPDTSISAVPPPAFGPHLRATTRQALSRGAAARATRGSSLSAATALSVVPLIAAVGALVIVFLGGTWRALGAGVLGAYVIALALTGTLAALRFRSLRVGALTPIAIVLTQAAYVAGFARGLLGGREVRHTPARDSASPHNLDA
jgi:hypothetical protein